MANIKEQSLSKALTAKMLPDLPKQYRDDCGEFWLEAIVLVRKLNMSQSYAVAKRDADGKISYTADFGDVSPISGLISIHPYMYLNKEKYMPFETIEQKRIALVKYIGDDEESKEAVDDMTDEEVEHAVLEIAINSQYAGESITETHNAILEAVGVEQKSTIKFEKDEQAEEPTEDNEDNDDTGGFPESDGEQPSEISADEGEIKTDNGSDTDIQSDDTIPTETAQVTEEKPKNKGGRPKGSKTTKRTTTRRKTSK